MSAARIQVVSMNGKPVNGPAWITDDNGNHTPIEPSHDIREIAATCLANSERWFPTNHTTLRSAVTHCTLGLAGEAGETANRVKKLYGYMDQRRDVDPGAVRSIVEELVDTLIYDLVLLRLFGADIPQAIADKVAICEARWGKA